MLKYKCKRCGWIYDPEKGVKELEIKPGVDFKDLPDDFVCPKCGAGKEELFSVD
jgi:rubredoxin